MADVALQSPAPSNEDILLVPEKSARDWGVALLLFLGAVLFLWPFLDFTTLFPDEGITLQGAQRILDGQVLYRDFFTFYTPGSYYWTALRFKLLGSSFFAGRVVLVVYGGVISVALYMLARRVCSQGVAILTAYLFLVIGLPYRFLVLHNWDSTVLAVLALYAAVWWAESSRQAWAFATGTLVSLTCLFEQSKGAGLVVGLGVGFLLIARFGGRPNLFRRPNLTVLLAGLAWPAVLTFVYFASQHGLHRMIEDWLWPLVHYSLANRQPYGYVPITFRGWEALYGSGSLLRTMFHMVVTSPFFVIPFLPFLSAAILVLVICRMRRGSSPDATNSYYVLVCATGIGLVLGVVATGRPDVDHLIYVSPPLILLLGMVLSGQLVKSRLLTEVRPLLFTFFVVTFTAFGMTFLLSGPLSAGQSLETRRGHIKLPCCDTMIPFLERYVAPEGKVLVYPYQPLYYFLSGTSSSTSFDYLQLGMHSPEQMERALVELAATPAQVVIWLPTFNTESIPGYWPSTPPTALARDPIRDFILAHYRLCATDSSEGFRVLILMPKGSTCSPQLNGGEKDG